MPRSEVQEIVDSVQNVVTELFNDKIQLTCCGSYRRLKPSCGDVDILLSRNDDIPNTDELERIIDRCHEIGFLTEHLARDRVSMNSKKTDDKKTDDKISDSRHSYMGVCLLKGEGRLHRRIDIKIYPRKNYPYAILYFTGNCNFTVKKNGYLL
eukprot:GHVL01006458.1.p1 GENE.GHVL01006458.1~~GHVL01006458.1.p1  ORF type:complete len:153 (+),score=37.50 GHVL01006458.1:167-625(+)